MTGFTIRKIKSKMSLGEYLKERRESIGYSLDEAAAETEIQKKYLSALEEGRYDFLGGEVYIKEFLKKYGHFLSLNPQNILDIYQKRKNILAKRPSQKIKKINLWRLAVFPFLVRKGIFILVILVILSYLGFKIVKAVSPPLLNLSSPQDNLITSEHLIFVQGKVDNEAIIEINQQEVFKDNDGSFTEEVPLGKGLNIIEIKAKKKYGRDRVVFRRILVEK